MGHHHGHGHAGHDEGHQHGGDGSQKALTWALILNGGFLFIEAGVGWVTGSLALLSDAAHMLSDVGALLLALGALRLSRLATTTGRTFGLVRAEVLGGFLNGISLAAASLWIVWEAFQRLLHGVPELAGMPILVVGVIGLLINLGSAWALYRSGGDNLNVRAALAHMLADALGSVAAVAAAVLVMAGIPAADAVLSVLVAALVGYGSWSILRETGRVLLQLPPPTMDVAQMTQMLLATDNVLGVHDLHVWTLDGKHAIVTAHLVVKEGHDFRSVCEQASGALKERFGVDHATLQLEVGPCERHDCGIVAQADPDPSEPPHSAPEDPGVAAHG